MDVPTAIKHFSINHDPQWFSDIQHEFKADKDYDTESDTITKEVCTMEPVDLTLLMPGTFDPNNHLCEESYYDIEVGLFWYCWQAYTGPIISKHIVLKKTLEYLIGVVGDAISHTGDIEIKYRIITAADKLLTDEAGKMMNGQIGSYCSLIKKFIYEFRQSIKDNYGNILWLYRNNEGTISDVPQNSEDPKESLKIKRLLSLSFFENMLTWRDIEGELIIDIASQQFSKEYAKILFQIYRGNYTPQDLKINFLWDKHTIYYIIKRIIKSRSKLKLGYIIECNVIQIKGDPITYQPSRTGASKFTKANSDFKQLLDEWFDDEIYRKNR
jgi:hypothetical protein